MKINVNVIVDMDVDVDRRGHGRGRGRGHGHGLDMDIDDYRIGEGLSFCGTNGANRALQAGSASQRKVVDLLPTFRSGSDLDMYTR
jgi:hypothetical protein